MDSLKIADLIARGDIVGADRGFNVRADTLRYTADGVPFDTIADEIVAVLAEWNAKRDALSALFYFNTTDEVAFAPLDPNAGEDFEQASEFGVPKSTRRTEEVYKMGFPLEWWDIATRFTEAYLREASAADVRLQVQNVLEKDNRKVFRDTMTALTSRPASIEARPTTRGLGIPIFSLWDGLGDYTPPAYEGRTFSSSHTHYLVSGAATLDSGDVEQLIGTVREHGFGTSRVTERLLILVHPDQAEVITSFRAGVTNNNSAVAKHDFIPSDIAPAFLTSETVVGPLPPTDFHTLEIMGSYADALIYQDYKIPPGYVIAVATSGPGSTRNPVAFRQFPRSEWQGLIQRQTEMHPLRESYFQRGFGVGVRNRSAAAVMQIKASGSYENPVWA